MSYLNQAHDPRRRATAIAGVIIVHAAMAFAVVVGLTVTGAAPQIEIWNPIPLTPDPQPTPPPPRPQKQEEAEDSFVVVPTKPIDIVIDRRADHGKHEAR